MGFKRSVKAAVKAVQKAAAPVTRAIKDTANVSKDLTKGGLSGGLQTLGSLAKGDVKGAAGGLLKLGEVGTKGILDSVKASGNLSTGLLSNVGSAVGSKDITKTAENIKREGDKGVDQYGGMAVDIGANALTGGTYGAAKTALQRLQEGGLKGVVNPKNIKSMVMDYAASQAGVDPDALKAAQAAAKGDLKGAALQAMGSPAINKQSLDMAKAALKGGDLKDILKSPEMKSALASGVGAVAGAYGTKVDPELLKAGVGVSLGESAKGEAAKFGAAKAGLGETQADLAANLAKGQSLKEAGMDYGLKESGMNQEMQGVAKQAIKGEFNPQQYAMQKTGLDQRIQQAKDIRSQAQGMRDQARDIRSQAQDLRSQALGMPQQLTESAMGEMDMAKQDLQNRAMGATMEAVSPMMSSAKSQMDQFKPSKRGRRMKALLKRGSYRIG
jgi:hypothetical protein